MRRMDGLSAERLASAGGTTRETIQRLSDLGLVEIGDDGYPRPSIARVRLLLGFQSIGVSLEAVAEGARVGAFDLRFIDELMPSPTPLLEETYDGLADRLELPVATADSLREILGTIDASGEEPVREDDAQIFALLVDARTQGASDRDLVRIIGIMATAMQTIVRAQRDFVEEVLITPALDAGLSERDALATTSAARREYRRIGAELTMTLLRRFVDDAVFQNLVEMGERALRREGIVQSGARSVPAIAFADVTGYTAITDELGDEEAATTARRFGTVVDRSSVIHGGRLVKLLGDGAMIVFDDVKHAVEWAVGLTDRADEEHLPPMHVGIDAGSFVRRDGDYFGAVVNVASRVADRAGPGEVLVTPTVAEGCTALPGIGFEEVGLTRLKNVAAPVLLFRANAIPVA